MHFLKEGVEGNFWSALCTNGFVSSLGGEANRFAKNSSLCSGRLAH